VAIVTDQGLRERGFGEFEGHTFKEISERWPEEAERWRKRDPDFAPRGAGESISVFFDRCVTVATRLAAAHPGETIAVVSHGGVMDCLYRAASRLDLQAPRSWLLGNASINRLLYTPGGFTLVGWSDNAHLERAALDESNDRVGNAA
jgi:probable phosphoglycerate mutase